MAAIVGRQFSTASLLVRKRPICMPLASYSSSASPSPSASKSKKLVLYSKPGCCLCDGLKEKLQAAFLLSGPHSLHDVDLQVRDITTNAEWERAYQYEIPVLAKVLSDGTEGIFPRKSGVCGSVTENCECPECIDCVIGCELPRYNSQLPGTRFQRKKRLHYTLCSSCSTRWIDYWRM